MPSVEGVDDNVPPKKYGVRGTSRSGLGVFGESDSSYGVYGYSNSSYGVFGYSNSSYYHSAGVYGSSQIYTGVMGSSYSGHGVTGSCYSGPGVSGSSNKSSGVSGGSESFAGVFGTSRYGTAVWGESYTGGGVNRTPPSYTGVFGHSNIGPGVAGYSESGSLGGVYGYSPGSFGVQGLSDRNFGVEGFSHESVGVHGKSPQGYGISGESIRSLGVFGYSDQNVGVYGSCGLSSAWAGYFNGRVEISGNLKVWNGGVEILGNLNVSGTKKFKIDHPLDPSNKYLYHSSVESSDMKNVYDGVVVLDANGEAEIELPDWFGALNKDFRYQLTPIGAPGPNLYIAEEISDGVTNDSNKNNRFKIAGGNPSMKVSWQVTGIRKDPWANANRIQVEEDKPAKERGYYLHPDLYGQPEEKGISQLLFPREEKWQEVPVK